jgi:serine/threonine-protein kinase
MLGQRIGNYQIVREIAAGGMGMVYLAQNRVIGRLAAVKCLLPELSANEEMIARIFNEARAAALIRHPGLVDVYDFGRLPDGRAYIVMEYLEGETLAALLARAGRLPVDLALALARQVGSAVAAAHERGIVHRDLKPDNVFIVRDDDLDAGVRARVLDFGIAKLAADLGGSRHTRTGRILGTPHYMAPEQCRASATVDARTDVYALGCILFEMLTGRRTVAADGIGEVIAAQLFVTPPRPSEIEASVPGWLDRIVARAVAKEPSDRFATMAELVVALGGRPRRTSSSITPVSSPIPSTFRSAAGELGPAPRTVRPWALVALTVALAIAVGLAFVPWRATDPAPATQPRPGPPQSTPRPPEPPPPAPAPEPPPAPPPPAPTVRAAPIEAAPPHPTPRARRRVRPRDTIDPFEE